MSVSVPTHVERNMLWEDSTFWELEECIWRWSSLSSGCNGMSNKALAWFCCCLGANWILALWGSWHRHSHQVNNKLWLNPSVCKYGLHCTKGQNIVSLWLPAPNAGAVPLSWRPVLEKTVSWKTDQLVLPLIFFSHFLSPPFLSPILTKHFV